MGKIAIRVRARGLRKGMKQVKTSNSVLLRQLKPNFTLRDDCAFLSPQNLPTLSNYIVINEDGRSQFNTSFKKGKVMEE